MQAQSILPKIEHKARVVNPNDTLGKQRRAQLLNTILIIVMVAGLAFIFGTKLIAYLNTGIFQWFFLALEAGTLVFVLGCYILNRLGYSYLAALTFFFIINVSIIFNLFNSVDGMFIAETRTYAPMLIIPVVAAGVIIGPRYSVIFGIISIASLLQVGFSRAKPGYIGWETPSDVLIQLQLPIALIFMMAGLSWLFESNIQSLITQLTSQNQSLDVAIRELARRSEVEKQLRLRVDELTGQVSGAFELQNRNTIDQISAVLRVTTTIEELSQINETIAQAASQVDSTAQRALRVVEDGTDTVRNGLESLLLLNQQAQEVAKAMDQVYQQARQIDQIIELINEMADETNLLALNAKIEAAGAREYGRRFASVANEVQRLANRSRDATSQVQQVVEEVRLAIENSSAMAQKGMKEAAEIMSGTRSMEQTLEGIVSMVENTATLARQISLSIQEQRGATIEVVETMRHISNASTTVTQGSRNLMDSMHNLNEAVSKLNSVAS